MRQRPGLATTTKDLASDPAPRTKDAGLSLGRISGRATIRDVSRIAEVSIKTVSRVMNNQNYVSAETRARVEQVMAELCFQPSSAARALAGHRSHQVVVICDNPSPWYVYEVQYGVRIRCQRDRVRMIAQPYDRGSPTLLEDILTLVDQVHPDGLVLTPPVCDATQVLDELLSRKVPFVRIQPGIRAGISSSVSIDNEQAAQDVTRHLLELGHTRIGFIVGDRGYMSSDRRLDGFLSALSEAGILIPPDYIRFGLYDFASGVEQAERLLALPEPPTAIFASNDDMAAGVLATAHREGISVPGDLSVVGFDDTPFASVVWPALTTVRQPVRLLAEAAADLLLTATSEPEDRKIAYELVVRQSTGPVKRS